MDRQIKQDGKGYYLNFGPIRLRPFRPMETKFNLEGMVSIILVKHNIGEGIIVYQNVEEYSEFWKRSLQTA